MQRIKQIIKIMSAAIFAAATTWLIGIYATPKTCGLKLFGIFGCLDIQLLAALAAVLGGVLVAGIILKVYKVPNGIALAILGSVEAFLLRFMSVQTLPLEVNLALYLIRFVLAYGVIYLVLNVWKSPLKYKVVITGAILVASAIVFCIM